VTQGIFVTDMFAGITAVGNGLPGSGVRAPVVGLIA
jgi:hypothetical protein